LGLFSWCEPLETIEAEVAFMLEPKVTKTHDLSIAVPAGRDVACRIDRYVNCLRRWATRKIEMYQLSFGELGNANTPVSSKSKVSPCADRIAPDPV
jgi:hypothetical protein